MGLQNLDKDESRQTRQSRGIDTKQTGLVQPWSLEKAFLLSGNTEAVLNRSYVFGVCPAALGGPHFALSHQPQGQVGQRRQVAAGPHCSLLGDKGQAGGCRGQTGLGRPLHPRHRRSNP